MIDYNYYKANHAAKHPAAGLGWLYLQDAASRQLSGGPPQVNPDPHQSGQNPEFTSWAWEQTKQFAKEPIYLKQIEEKLALLDRHINSALNDIQGAQIHHDKLKVERDAIADLIA